MDHTRSVAGLDLLSSAVLLADEHLRIGYLNPAAENMFGINKRHWLNRALSELLGDSPILDKAIGHALSEGWHYTGYAMQFKRDASIWTLDCVVTPIQSETFRLLFEFLPVDTRQKIAREEQLAQQQQTHREMIRNLAHEIRNPLGGIRGSAQLLERELSDPRLREYTNVIIEESDRLQDLMTRLLLSRGTPEIECLNVHEVLEHVKKLVEAEFPGIVVTKDYDPSLPEINADKKRLIQAILNIVKNAAQAQKGNGTIILRTRIARQVMLNKRLYKLAIQLQIVDHGPGIPEDLIDHIFYPLVSGKSEGSGLGLSLAQAYIEQHSGTISVESRAGLTCFTVLLPVSHEWQTSGTI
ncbi:MAG: PAS domain-containing protein [Burkholderiales bacterium]|jgi:two-component system nitrogen regulation sensor histidine kinase GlnL|nr:PAS domain-containing protein [Burkholderiales bacterium]